MVWTKWFGTLALTLVLCLGGAQMTGCEQDAGDHLEDATEDVQDAGESVGDAIEEGVDDVEDEIDD